MNVRSVMFEPDDEHFSQLQVSVDEYVGRYTTDYAIISDLEAHQEHVLLRAALDPSNAPELIANTLGASSQGFDFVKIDVGSSDCDLVEALLGLLGKTEKLQDSGLPSVVILQTNLVPPPFRHAQHYVTD